MDTFVQSKRAYFLRLAVIAGAVAGTASANAAGVDVTQLLADIAAQATPIAAVGGAVLLIHLGVKCFKWIRSSMS